ncbi:MAG: precorrin-6y C5,15-methyltransferase (decarboxylating) subunit CbiE [Pseudomonadota bacterium]
MGNKGSITNKEKIRVIGLNITGEPLSLKKRQYIKNADVLIGGKRQIEQALFFNGKTILITKDIDSLIDEIKQCIKKNLNIVVLATGDPLLFGIGNTLIQHFGIDSVEIYPGISAAQVALSRLGLKTDEAVIISRHGTHTDDLLRLLNHNTGVILTSNTYSPYEIIQELITSSPQTKKWTGHVCQCLGTKDEIIQSGQLQQLCSFNTFRVPNILVVQNPDPAASIRISAEFGLPDDAYEHDANMITHSEIRAITLSKLKLGNAEILWDVGAGSGSVGIESALLNPYARVFCIEKNTERIENITANAKKHKVNNIFVIEGQALEECLTLPAPDRVFIGGGGEDLPDLLSLCYQRLSNEGIMVVNTVTIESFEVVRTFFKQINKEIECISIQISRLHTIAKYHTLKPENPITLFGIKK